MADECAGSPGKVAPVVDRNRCEGEEQCVQVCPYNVFEVRVLAPVERAELSLLGRLKAWAHGNRQAFVVALRRLPRMRVVHHGLSRTGAATPAYPQQLRSVAGRTCPWALRDGPVRDSTELTACCADRGLSTRCRPNPFLSQVAVHAVLGDAALVGPFLTPTSRDTASDALIRRPLSWGWSWRPR